MALILFSMNINNFKPDVFHINIKNSNSFFDSKVKKSRHFLKPHSMEAAKELYVRKNIPSELKHFSAESMPLCLVHWKR